MRLVLGMGCDRGTSQLTLETAIDQALAIIGASRNAITALATIDKKNDEVALLELAAVHRWPLNYYTAEELAQVEVPNPSEVVRKHMGTPTVAEAAALLAANCGIENLILEKHKYRGYDDKNATVSIVRLCNEKG
jgi:cobalt-precorrin 5A hydrolase